MKIGIVAISTTMCKSRGQDNNLIKEDLEHDGWVEEILELDMEQLVSFCYFVIGSKLVELQRANNNNERR
jgi:hypothetical protein